MKTCFKCGCRKKLTEFYRHPMMADGHLGKCKECNKKDVRERYALTIEERHEYDRKRYREPKRRMESALQLKLARLRNPQKFKARRAVAYAIRTGKMKATPCAKCKSTVKVQAHHHDYSKPLDIEWLCFVCHRKHAHGQRPSERKAA